MQNVTEDDLLKIAETNCRECSLCLSIPRGPMPFVRGRNDLPILFVTSSPTPEEYQNGYPFASKNVWDLMCNVLMTVGFEDPRFHRTNAVKCHTPSKSFTGNSEAELRACNHWLEQDIQLLKPRIIVAFGSVAAHRFSSEYLSGVVSRKKELSGITEKHGRIEWSAHYNCWVLYCFHPSYVLRNLGKYQQFFDAMSKLYRLYANNYQLPDLDQDQKHTCFLPSLDGGCEEFLQSAREFLEWLSTQPEYSLDLETTGLNWFEDDILMVSFSWRKGRAACVEWHPALYDHFKKVLENSSRKVLQNAKFDYQFLKYRYGIDVNNLFFDTMIAAHLIDENSPNGLEVLQSRYLGLPVYKETFWKEKTAFDKRTDKTDQDIQDFKLKFMKYACEDADYTLQLKEIFEPMLKDPFPTRSEKLELTPWHVFERVSMPYVPILAEIENNGIPYNSRYRDVLEKKLLQDRDDIYNKAKQILVDTLFPNAYEACTQYSSATLDTISQLVSEIASLKRMYPDIPFGSVDDEAVKVASMYQTFHNDLQVENYTDQISNLLSCLRVKEKNRYVGAIPTATKIQTLLIKHQKKSLQLDSVLSNLENSYHWLSQLVEFKFNISSTKDMTYYLYNVLRLPIKEKTKKGAPSTSAATLEKLYDKHEFVRHVVNYRKIEHDISNYIEGVKNATNPTTKRVHPSFSQVRTVTGRLACSNPAMHGIKRVFEIRNQFSPPNNDLNQEPMLFIEGDYSQAEVRFLGVMSKDPVLLDVLKDGGDIHEENARRIFNVPEGQKVTKEQRSATKQIVFAIIYGSLVSSVAKSLNISVQQAQTYFDKFYGVYTKVKEWMDGMKTFVGANGFVSNYYGRIRRLPTIWSSEENHVLEALRQCINAPIQGSATGDMVGLTHQKLQRFIDNTPEYMNCVKQIHNHHDAILIEVPARLAWKFKDEVREIAESADDSLPIKMKFDVDVVCCWGGAPMTEVDIQNYIDAHRSETLPVSGYCDHISETGKRCNNLFLPFPGQTKCPDHYVKGEAEKWIANHKNQLQMV